MTTRENSEIVLGTLNTGGSQLKLFRSLLGGFPDLAQVFSSAPHQRHRAQIDFGVELFCVVSGAPPQSDEVTLSECGDTTILPSRIHAMS
jgi:hypothetical protein